MANRRRTLPKEFARHAADLAKANPKAFPSEAAALESMSKSYNDMFFHDAEAVSTGGYLFRFDGDGDVELWVSPSVAFGRAQ